jgi:organic hydroperoxide reductase OsmC/OhrA
MSQHSARLTWARRGAEFQLKTYSRDHEAVFDGGVTVPVSAAAGPAVPPGTVGAHTVDPEELTVAAVASCHMLFFLALAAKRGLTIDAYDDDPVGVLESKDGVTAFARITLRPRVTWAGAAPEPAVIDELHHGAHKRCYIANSLKAEILVEPQAAAAT